MIKELLKRKNNRWFLLASTLVFIVIATISFNRATLPVGATNVTGTISTNTTWNAAGSPYVLTGNVTVSGATLTIDASAGPVEVRAGGAYYLRAITGGAIVANGTAVNRITFTHNTSTALGAWAGVRINAGGSGTFNFVTVKYASYGINADGGTALVVDSIIDTNSYGVNAYNAGTITSLRNTYNKNTYPVSMEWDSALNLGSGADVDIFGTSTNANTYMVIGLGAYDNNTLTCPANICTVVQKSLGAITNAPYVVPVTNYTLDGSDDITNINPGVIVKISSGYVYIRYGAKLQLNGNAGDPVYFTSSLDDSIGGDSNANGSATTPAAGNWGGILFQSTGANTFSYGVVKYSSWGLLPNVAGVNVTVTDSLFESNSYAINAYAGSTITTARNTFKKNAYPASFELDSLLTFGGGADADIFGTSTDRNTYEAVAVDAYDNNSSACAADSCTIMQRNFAGISNIPYVIINNAVIDGNDTVTFEAGIILKFYDGQGLYIRSSTVFRSNGTTENPVYFTTVRDDTIGGDTNANGSANVPAAGNWQGIRYEGGVNNIFSYGNVRYSSWGVITPSAVSVTVTDTVFENNSYGINAYNGGTITTARNTFNKNAFAAGMEFDGRFNFGSGADVDIWGTGGNANTYPAIAIDAYDNSTTVCPADVCTLSQKTFGGIVNIPYVVQNNAVLEGANDTVNIDPGVMLKFNGVSLYVRSTVTFRANGVPGNPVYFTTFKDDSIGGDTNVNGSANVPVAGDWGSIRYEGGTNNIFSNNVVKYSTWGVLTNAITTVTVTDNLFENNTYAINPYSSGTIITARNIFKKNTFPASMELTGNIVPGSGADTDIFGIGVERNTYEAIGLGAFNGISTTCPLNQCTLTQETFGGIVNIPYVVQNNIVLDGGDDTVTVASGVIIKFNGNAWYVRNGCVFVPAGVPGTPVYFTSFLDDSIGGDTNANGSANTPAAGNWGGIRYEGTAASTFAYNIVKYSSNGVLTTSTGSVTVADNYFESNTYAVNANNLGPITTARNIFYKNTYAVTQEWDTVMTFGQGADVDILGTGANKNTYNVIGVGAVGNYSDCPIAGCQVSQKTFAGIQNIPYQIVADYVFDQPNDVINIDPGVIVKMTGTLYLRSSSHLNVNGTSTGWVYFTSYRDDVIGGDTNNDGTATVPVKGNWGSIKLETTGAQNYSFLSLRYSLSGIYATTSGVLTVTDSTFENNTNGMTIALSTSPVLTRVNFIGNTTGLRNNNATIIQAQNLWWNSINGPNDTNATGQCPLNATSGDAVTDTSTTPVNYCPYAVSKFNSNTAPTATNTVVNNGDVGINLTESTTTTVTCTTTIADADGYTDISGVVGKLYQTTQGDSGSDNGNYRYTGTCVPGTGSGTLKPFTCTFNVLFHAEPTDTGATYESDTWTCKVSPYDTTGIGTTDTDTIEMNSLVGIEVSSVVNFGNILKGTDSGSTNVGATITNSGNVPLDVEVSGTNMCTDFPTCSGGVLAVTQQQYATIPFTYGTGTILNSSPALVIMNITKPTITPSNQSAPLYWGLAIPIDAPQGSYTGQNSFIGVKH